MADIIKPILDSQANRILPVTVIAAVEGLPDALNDKSNILTFVAGDNIVINRVGDSITIESSGSGGALIHNDLSLRDASDAHPMSAVTGLVSALAGKALSVHTHDDRYYTESEMDTLLSGKAPTSHTHTKSQITDFAHTHDDRYYTEAEMDTLLSGKSATSHLHDDRYFTETEVTTLLSGKAATSHTHTIADVTNLQTTLDGKAPTVHTHTKANITDFAHTHVKADITDFAHTHVKADITDFAHGHGNITNAGAIGSTTDLVVVTGASGVLTTQSRSGIDSRSTFPPSTHTHAIADTTGLQTALDGKASSSHTHTKSQITDFLNATYPVGAIYMSTVSTSPATLFGGTWEAIANQFLVASGGSFAAGSTGGALTHSHTSAAHTHTVAAHSHTSAAHTHTVAAHSHTSAAHTHSTPAHSHAAGGLFAKLAFWSTTSIIMERVTSVAAWADNLYKTLAGNTGNSPGSNTVGVGIGGSTASDGASTTGSTTPDNTGSTALTTDSTTPGATGSTVLTTDSTTPGATGSSSSLPPYLSVYMWRRTA